MSWPLFVNWHTPEYADEAARLRASLERLDLPYEIVAEKSLGSWQRNCCRKAAFVQETAMNTKFSGRALAWIDADAEVAAPPWLLAQVQNVADLAYHVHEGQAQTSLVLFGPGFLAFAFIDYWRQLCQEAYMKTDQDHFNAALSPTGFAAVAGLTRVLLPGRYCCFPESVDFHRGAIVRQYQASRRLARVTGSEPPPAPKGGGA